MGIDVIVPVYRPDKKFEKLFSMLLSQSLKPDRIIVLNTEAEGYENRVISQRIEKVMKKNRFYGKKQIDVHVAGISKESFDHGGTRRYGVTLSSADYFMMMTQDAVPADDYLIERLINALQQEGCAAAYARQCASLSSGVVEQYTRLFNYPSVSALHTKEDLPKLGIKTFFCSDVCAVYRRSAYEQVGGFPERTIFNEDMILASRFIEAGYGVAYTAEAKVMHSHNYSLAEQFRRNFDIGVSHLEYRDVFGAVPPEKEGGKMVFQTMRYLIDQHYYIEILDLLFSSAAKFCGYQLGKRYRYLPKDIVLSCTMNPRYFKD